MTNPNGAATPRGMQADPPTHAQAAAPPASMHCMHA